MINQKRRRTDGAAAPQDGKPPAKTRRAEAAARRGPLRRDAHAGRRKSPHREGFPRAAAPIGRAAGAARRTGKTNVFCPLATCQRRHILQTPARARFCPPSAKGGAQRRQSPRRPPRRPEARPQTRAGRRSAPAGLPTGRGREPPPLPPACGRAACFTAIAKDVFRPCFSLF